MTVRELIRRLIVDYELDEKVRLYNGEYDREYELAEVLPSDQHEDGVVLV